MPDAKEFEGYARDCVKMAEQPLPLEVRQQLLDMARLWMQAAMEEDKAQAMPASSYGSPHQAH